MMSLVAMMAVAVTTPAQPIGDPRSWITSDDYPAVAVGAEGPVRAILSIDQGPSWNAQ